MFENFQFSTAKTVGFCMPQKSLIFEGFWGTNRTGKINKYNLNEIKNVEFGPSSRLIFLYNEKRVVLPLREENLKKLKEIKEVLNL